MLQGVVPKKSKARQGAGGGALLDGARECLAIDVGHGLSGRDVATTLELLRFERGLPQRIYCDKGAEFISGATGGVTNARAARRRRPRSSSTLLRYDARGAATTRSVRFRPSPRWRSASTAPLVPGVHRAGRAHPAIVLHYDARGVARNCRTQQLPCTSFSPSRRMGWPGATTPLHTGQMTFGHSAWWIQHSAKLIL